MENSNSNGRFNVVVRIRPIIEEDNNQVLTEEDLYLCVNKISDTKLSIVRPTVEEREYDFDYVMGNQSSQEQSFDIVARKVVNDVMEGYNGTIMAYGQTGSGKTFTIFGKKSSMDYNSNITPDMGIVPRSIKQIFGYIADNPNKAQFQIRVSFMQVYMEQISDLIVQDASAAKQGANKESLQIREDPKSGIFVQGLKQIRVTSEEELLNLIKYGSKFRFTSPTSMNKASSRSHALLQILVEQKWIEENSGNDKLKKRHYKKGLLTIVDLAGSERISKTGTDGIQSKEAIMINKSISALGNCINALASNVKDNHVPFRDSKLTRILTECLGGNSKTAICACISPFLMNYDESLTTLQCASRAIKIKVNPLVNERIEMKKIKEKLNEIINIKNSEMLLKQNNQLGNIKLIVEKDADDLKNSLYNFKNDLKRAKYNNTNNFQDGNEEGQRKMGRSASQEAMYKTNSSYLYDETELNNILKKFHYIILQLQNEASNQVSIVLTKALTIYNLQEENKRLKEQLLSKNSSNNNF